jgi:hypothetical protein
MATTSAAQIWVSSNYFYLFYFFLLCQSPFYVCVCVWKENIIKAKSIHTRNSGYLWMYNNINYDCTTWAFSGRTRSPQPNDIQSQLAIVTGPKIPYIHPPRAAAHPPPFPLTSTWSVKGHWLTWRKWRHQLELKKGIHIHKIVNKLHRSTLHGPSKNRSAHARVLPWKRLKTPFFTKWRDRWGSRAGWVHPTLDSRS